MRQASSRVGILPFPKHCTLRIIPCLPLINVFVTQSNIISLKSAFRNYVNNNGKTQNVEEAIWEQNIWFVMTVVVNSRSMVPARERLMPLRKRTPGQKRRSPQKSVVLSARATK
jgi:hypothetical protein